MLRNNAIQGDSCLTGEHESPFFHAIIPPTPRWNTLAAASGVECWRSIQSRLCFVEDVAVALDYIAGETFRIVCAVQQECQFCHMLRLHFVSAASCMLKSSILEAKKQSFIMQEVAFGKMRKYRKKA